MPGPFELRAFEPLPLTSGDLFRHHHHHHHGKALTEPAVVDRVFPTVKSFVDFFAESPSKARYIQKILIATNGIAAVKCITSMRRFLMQVFKDDRIVKFICMTTEQEVASRAEYLKLADGIVFSPSGANTNNYANVDEIIEHAVRCGVDAVWAGWGHASENPRLPTELSRHGIAFIGPPADAMFALGDKIASTIIAQTVDIPTIEWSGSGVRIPDHATDKLSVSDDLFTLATVSTAEEALECLKTKQIDYPIMIKASEGGGGKGIRKCSSEKDFVVNFHRVQAEVPGSPVFLMKCLENARHIEVQLIADHYGDVVPLFTRDCSVQRRCQKIIEEAPAGIAPASVLRGMQQDAVNLAKRVGYVSAGTVEYMYLPSTNQYFFLELNPRLQVEHPCTEMVTDVNIPAVQLQIAMGLPLHRILDIRLFYGLDRYGVTPLPNDQVRTDTKCTVIAARITSEDPAEGFRPASGQVEVLNFHSNQAVWGYFSVQPTGKVHEFADSQFGHVFAKGNTRHEAISNLVCALKQLELRASFQSQVNYLVGLLKDHEFEQNTYHTGWLDERIAARVQSQPEHPLDIKIAVGATVIGNARMQAQFGDFQAAISRGQVLPTTGLTENLVLELVHKNVKFDVEVARYGPKNFLIGVNGRHTRTLIHAFESDGGILVEYDGRVFQCHLDEEMERFKVTIGHNLTVFEKENDPSVLISRNAGRFLQYLKSDGDALAVGEVFAEMESMKMVIAMDIKKVGGRLIQVARPGQVLFPGSVIARLEVGADISAARPTRFDSVFEDWRTLADHPLRDENTKVVRLDTRFEQLISSCHDILAGYAVPGSLAKQHTTDVVDQLLALLADPQLPFALYRSVLHVVRARIQSPKTAANVDALLNDSGDRFPASHLLEVLDDYLATLNPATVGLERPHFEKLQATAERFVSGLAGHKKLVIGELLNAFVGAEMPFQSASYDTAVSTVKSLTTDENEAVRMIYAHKNGQGRDIFVRELVSRLDPDMLLALKPTLKQISNLLNAEKEKIALYVRTALSHAQKATTTLYETESLDDLLQIRRLPSNAARLTLGDGDASSLSSTVLYTANDVGGIRRLFIRAVISLPKGASSSDALKSRLSDAIDGVCGALRVAVHEADKKVAYDCNHVFVCLEQEDSSTLSDAEDCGAVIHDVLFAFDTLLTRLHVTEVEVAFKVTANPFRVIYTNETGVIPEFALYRITADGKLTVVGDGTAKFDGADASAIHHPIDNPVVQKKRALAHRLGTTYCYDLPTVFGYAVLRLWHDYQQQSPNAYSLTVQKLTPEQQAGLHTLNPAVFCKTEELVLDDEESPIRLLESGETRPAPRGMVAWVMKLYTPDLPSGREVITIANDITFQMGSFSMREHRLYHRASEYSRLHDLPRVYVAANSGARIGFAADVKQRLGVIWKDAERPEEGFSDLCFDDQAPVDEKLLNQVKSHSVDGTLVIDAVVGKEDDIGVENLVGSGLIAGETSAAYQSVPTYCLVTGRAVGIGAYAARLSHRIVQVDHSHLILTGMNALNSVLGREIYTSNSQLGGTQIMHRNGVSHSVASSDLEGAIKIVRWISYLPTGRLDVDDDEREVDTILTKAAYDPRDVLDPPTSSTGGPKGLFDAGSFDEVMDGWAKTIIAARARICGMAVGVVAVETRTVSVEIPADPGAAESETKTVQQAGQVWYPDSAYKTAEAINDFNREGLPLVLLANIRGFSGGQKDMFEMVLKFGAAIVDALQAYTQPIVVYIPPYGELRGGAWAVLDTQINPTCITMLADTDSRGGVLEPDGIVEIKFRQRDLLVLMAKCDATLASFNADLAKETTEAGKKAIQKQISQRQTQLLPVYRTVAVKFADLHDTSIRMLAKGAIHDHIQWHDARNYLHRLLRVQTTRFNMARRYLKSTTASNHPLTVDRLTQACKWVDDQLSVNGVSFRLDNTSKTTPSQFVYDPVPLETFAASFEFQRALTLADSQRTTDVFLLKLSVLDAEARTQLIESIVQSCDPSSRLSLVRTVLSSLDDAERQSLLSA